jgi:hypothetical protein
MENTKKLEELEKKIDSIEILLERLLGMELDDLEELEKKIDSIENRVNKLERLVSEILLEL